MSEPKRGLALNALAELSQMSVDELKAILDTRLPEYGNFTVGEFCLDSAGYNRPAFRGFSFKAVLAIEIARQISDDEGLSLTAGLEMVTYTGAIASFPDTKERPEYYPDRDFWIAVLGVRSTWGDSSREGWPVTTFGPGEFWTIGHYRGALDEVMAGIKSRIIRDTVAAVTHDAEPDDFARVFMANVSAAARRLRKRAAKLGISLD